MNRNRQRVDALLMLYQQYKDLIEQESKFAQRLAKAKLTREPVNKLRAAYDTLLHKRQQISDTMTFDNPVIWMMYKFEAYADEPQPIRTMHDFRVHCSKPGYICTKRFSFLNEQLSNSHYQSLSDAVTYPDDMFLSDVYGSPALLTLNEDKVVKAKWDSFEYYKDGNRIAKWENYAS